MIKEFSGCWPTMITPFTDDNRVNFKAVKQLTEWYITHGASGIFAVCQSSEMFFLDEQEKLDIAKAVKDSAEGRIKVIASGHTADDKSKQIEELGKMAELGLDAIVMVSNRLAKAEDGDDVLKNNFLDIVRQLPGVRFGMYECPYPYLRLLSNDFLEECADTEALVFLKDVSCAEAIQKERALISAGKKISLFNANTSTVLSSLKAGYDGYNGVMGNFHIDLYNWLYTHYREEPELAQELSDFLTMAAVSEARAYPVNAKYHCDLTGIPMGIHTRSKDKSILNENARHEIQSLIRLEDAKRKVLGL
jgi:4-hydroxy-tetrahydrodipicolinate synthase